MVTRRMSLKRVRDIAGVRFGRLTAIQFAGLTKSRRARWLCRCDCGKETVVALANLRHGLVKSCGCLNRERTRQANQTHGLSKTREYRIWTGIKKRCENPATKGYADYGGRGIRVAAEWLDFARFMADMGPRPSGFTIERIDNNKGYALGNCRWAPKSEQSANRRTNHYLTHNGETHTVAEWARRMGMPASRLLARIRLGWPIEKALRNTRHERRT